MCTLTRRTAGAHAVMHACTHMHTHALPHLHIQAQRRSRHPAGPRSPLRAPQPPLHAAVSALPPQVRSATNRTRQFSNLCRHKRMHAGHTARRSSARTAGRCSTLPASLNKHRALCEGKNHYPREHAPGCPNPQPLDGQSRHPRSQPCRPGLGGSPSGRTQSLPFSAPPAPSSRPASGYLPSIPVPPGRLCYTPTPLLCKGPLNHTQDAKLPGPWEQALPLSSAVTAVARATAAAGPEKLEGHLEGRTPPSSSPGQHDLSDGATSRTSTPRLGPTWTEPREQAPT